MVWTVPITFYDDDPLTAAQLNTYVRDNLTASEAGIAQRTSRIITATGIHEITENQWARAYIHDQVVVDSKFFVTEDEEGNTYGPTVTVKHNGMMWLLYDCRIDMDTGGGNGIYGPIVDGQTPDSTSESLRSGNENFIRSGNFTLWTGEPGTSTITMGYGVSNGTSQAGFAQRRLTAIPL